MTDWYAWYPALYEADTLHLTAAQDGIYRRLIDWYMTKRCPLPDNDQALASIARVGLDEWNLHATIVRKFFKKRAGKLFHRRCDLELDKQDNRSKIHGEIARKGAAARWNKNKRLRANGKHDASLEHVDAMLSAPNDDASRTVFDATGQEKTVQDKKEEQEQVTKSALPKKSPAVGAAARIPVPSPETTSPPGRSEPDDGFSRADFDRLVVKLPATTRGNA